MFTAMFRRRFAFRSSGSSLSADPFVFSLVEVEVLEGMSLIAPKKKMLQQLHNVVENSCKVKEAYDFTGETSSSC